MSNAYEGYPSDKNGRYYYLSHPSLGVVAPYYLAFAWWGAKPNVLGLQAFNLGVQFLCALFLYRLLLRATEDIPGFSLPAVLGAGLYLWLPGPLWFHGNTYYVEILVQLPLSCPCILHTAICAILLLGAAEFGWLVSGWWSWPWC